MQISDKKKCLKNKRSKEKGTILWRLKKGRYRSVMGL